MPSRVFGWLGSGLGYLLFGAGVLVLLLWVLFPQETVRRFLEETLNRNWPALRWQVGGVALDLPAGVTLRAIEGYEKGAGNKPLLRIDLLTVQPQVAASLRAGQVQAGYRLAVGEGSLAGLVRVRSGNQEYQLEGTALAIKLTDLPLLNRRLGRALEGSISGTFIAAAARGKGTGGLQLEGRIKVENGRLGLKRPILGHTELPFSQGAVLVRGHGERLQFEEGVVASELFDGRFAGTMTLHHDLEQSQIDVRGALQPKNKLFKGVDNTVALQAFRVQLKDTPLPFRITGDLSNPGIHYEEFAMLVQTLEKELK